MHASLTAMACMLEAIIYALLYFILLTLCSELHAVRSFQSNNEKNYLLYIILVTIILAILGTIKEA